MLWGADGRDMNLEVLSSERERDRCLLLLIWKAGVGHIYNTKTEQTPRGVTVRFEGQPTSAMQECTNRTSSSCKYRPKMHIGTYIV